MRLSTLLLIFLLLLIVGLANGQVTIRSNDLKTDTVKTEMIVTTRHGEYGEVRAIYGYEVLKINSDTVIWLYLDKKKKPLSKNINVWMSKPIKL